MQILKALNWRYAVKRFNQEKINPELLAQLLEATRLSASAYGLQPYKLLSIESKSLRQRLLAHSYGQEKVLESSHLLVLAAENNAGPEMVNRYMQQYAKQSNKSQAELDAYSEHLKTQFTEMRLAQKQQWAHQQAYITLGQMLSSAAMLKIDSCPMAVNQEGYDVELGLAELGLNTTVVCAIGYRHPDDKQASKPKVRVDNSQFVIEYKEPSDDELVAVGF